MKETKAKRKLLCGAVFLAAFAVWTVLVRTVDVQSVGQNGTDIGFAAFNCRFHQLTGVHMALYELTDLLGYVPILVCAVYAVLGAIQLIRRRSLRKVDADILVLGVYYAAVILAFVIFELVPVNYRPILIEGRLEASYPSSTTLLVLSVMPTLIERLQRRHADSRAKRSLIAAIVLFSAFTVVVRLICGVHWFSDIVGGVLLSAGLFPLYLAGLSRNK